MRSLTRTQMLLLGLIFVVLVATKPLYAAPQSCFSEYSQFTTTSWTLYDNCIRDTNDDVWYQRLAVRQYCRLEWVSNAMQAEGTYAACMSGFTSLIR